MSKKPPPPPVPAEGEENEEEPGPFSNKQLKEFKAAFDTVDRWKEKKIRIKEIGNAFKLLGMLASEKEVNDILELYKDEQYVNFPLFLTILEQRFAEHDTEEEVREAFRVFDRDKTGYVDAMEMIAQLTNKGEKLEKEEIEELLRVTSPDEKGQIMYENFITFIYSKLRKFM
ncbi:neo-calmodulin-like [Aethina tumida]|uniref:neo-calmodulin-like n=1 Tax=Aethina tumida TaxID=116153 RepID=UPI002147C730|nr:neo-calmodulin-like [Aethina tumida]